jgi:hypothetical protein
MPSFRACFGSIFRIHTETGNIWTHLVGESDPCVVMGSCKGPLFEQQDGSSRTRCPVEAEHLGTYRTQLLMG